MTFTEILDEYGIPWKSSGEHHHVTTGWIGLDCPWCSPDSDRYRLGYNVAGNYLSCWTCGGVNLVSTLKALTRKDYTEVKVLLNGVDAPILDEPYRRVRVVFPSGVGPLGKSHRQYLESRGFEPDTISKMWNVQGIGLAVKLAWRLFIPITFRGKVVSWTTRSIKDDGVRYISARPEDEGMNAKELLYGEEHCRHSIIVCEGPLDVWKIGPGAVATLGISYSRTQLQRISQYPMRVICFDSELEAQKRAKRLAEDLAAFPGTTFNTVLDSAKDPGGASQKEIRQLRRFLQ